MILSSDQSDSLIPYSLCDVLAKEVSSLPQSEEAIANHNEDSENLQLALIDFGVRAYENLGAFVDILEKNNINSPNIAIAKEAMSKFAREFTPDRRDRL
jgi:hypothetical protein